MARPAFQRGGGPDLPEIQITAVNLRQVMADAKAVSPKLQRELRKSLRSVGDHIIADQRALLSAPLPGNAVKTGQRIRLVGGKGGKKQYLRAVNTYKAESASRSRSTGMRNRLKSGLKTRVVTGATRSGISIRADKSVGGAMTKTWNKRTFRHPVFGKKTYVTQFGQPYWWDPIKRGQQEARTNALAAIDKALEQIGSTGL
ncbi:hypothetical protein [Arthrobacter sp. B1805]|uniref:hypothetical protein n=1 Tax=Arthrobacter sp. B1805 TaxID=2058892 RepID=UPI000CE2E7B3|nr:hypothetical protein [Arthrobacter sp. B1805]